MSTLSCLIYTISRVRLSLRLVAFALSSFCSGLRYIGVPARDRCEIYCPFVGCGGASAYPLRVFRLILNPPLIWLETLRSRLLWTLRSAEGELHYWSLTTVFASPKSPTFSLFAVGSTKIFSGLISRWIRPD